MNFSRALTTQELMPRDHLLQMKRMVKLENIRGIKDLNTIKAKK